MLRLLTVTALAAALLSAQEPAKPAPESAREVAPQENFEAVIIPVTTLTGDSFDRLVRLLDVFGARIRADANLKTIVVYAPPETVKQIQKVVADLDQPGSPAAVGRNIDMTISLIQCGKAAAPEARAIPADLEPVVRQLSTATQCANPTLWDSLPLRVQEGREARQDMVLPGPYTSLPNLPRTFNVRLNAETVGTKDGSRFVRFSRIHLGLRVPAVSGTFASGKEQEVNYQYQYMDVGIDTSGDFFESQKTVLGKLSGTGGGETIYAVIALKILD